MTHKHLSPVRHFRVQRDAAGFVMRNAGRGKQVIFFLLFALVLTGCGRQHEFNGTKYDPPLAAPPLLGTNWDGTPFDLSELKGKVALIFFGYTFCPDICPLTLAEMKQVYNQLDDARNDVAVVFVSVDPERDTVERLAQYIPAFDASFYGVYVAPENLDAVKKDFGVFAEKRDPGDDSRVEYLVDHTGWIYVVDPKGDFRVAFGHDAAAENIVPDIQYLLR